ncbi:MAG: M48 family peptidase [Cytophagales bacterium]|nr:MAG: M48 family peptidase [Cytophagales bacterium]
MLTSQLLFIIIIFLVAFDFLLDQTMDYLNLTYQKEQLPDELKGIYDDEQFKKSQEYHKVNAKFDFIQSSFSFIATLIMLFSGGFGLLNEWLSPLISNNIIMALAYFGILFLASDIISLPFSIYKTFVIEEKFGFNKTSPKTYVLDKIKGYALAIVIGGILLYFLLWLILGIGENFWFYFWVVAGIFILLVNMFYTSVIMPLFNKLKPLENGSLKTAIETYSKKINFPLDNIFVLDGSKRSAKANAFFSGMGSKKKIVLYDTLINNHSEEELVAVLAHEVGHYKKKHIIWGYTLSILQIGFMLFILSKLIFNQEISKAFGANDLVVHINLIAFGILFSPLSHLIGIAMNYFSRKNEYEADEYAATTYGAQPLQEALKKLSANNLSNLTPHPAYVFFHYSHPPMLARLRFLKQFN